MSSSCIVKDLAFVFLLVSLQIGAAKRITADPDSIGWVQDDGAAEVTVASLTEKINGNIPEESGSRRHIFYLEEEGVACYCKAVDNASQCVDNKHRSDPEKPSGPRYFHGESTYGHKPLCCKLDWSSALRWKGWDYVRQDDFTRCMSDSRLVPQTSCCRLKDSYGEVGVRISRATCKSALKRDSDSHYDSWYLKSAPEFRLEDITGGQDYTGEDVPAEEARAFVEAQLVETTICDESGSGEGYRGCQSTTRGGRTCQKWTEQSPHEHVWTPRNYSNEGLGDHNYCRSPDGDPTTWCITTDPEHRVEYCDPVPGLAVRFGGKLQCGGSHFGSFDSLFADTAECRLRQGPSEQCCCLSASLEEATRCLPAEGAASEEAARRQVLNSTLKTWELKGPFGERDIFEGDMEGGLVGRPGRMEGRLVEAPSPDHETGMQDSLEGLADNPWRWAKAPRQWRRTCLETVQVPYVTRKNWTQRIYHHTYCRWCKHGTCREYDEKMGRCKRDYVKRIHTTHSQHYREECRRWQWDRECAAGTGLYIKQIDPGQCMREPDHSDGGLALTETAPRAFECPDGYSSGNGGTRKFQPGCTCRPQCGERKWTK